MTSKYAEDIATIKADVKYLVRGMEKLNDSQGKQWDEINANKGMIGRLEERQKNTEKDQDAWNKGLVIFSAAISAITGTIATMLGIKN